MIFFKKIGLLVAWLACLNSLSALEPADQTAIQGIIQEFTNSWNDQAGKGFADAFTEDADFVNVFGMVFKGKTEIEDRHVKILQTFQKDSKLEIVESRLREVTPGLVIAVVHWKLDGFRTPKSDINLPGEMREGIFTHVFILADNSWKITACQNTLISKN